MRLEPNAAIQRLAICGVFLLAAGCSSASKDGGGTPTEPVVVTESEFAFLVGTWTGTWTDTVFDVEGTLSATMTMSGTDVDATGVIGLQALGLGDEEGVATGTISGDTLTFTFEATSVGTGEGTFSGGVGSGMGSVMGMLDFGDFTFEGTATETTIDGTFQFTAPSGGSGVATLIKQ
jgi:hypothetical protein